MLLPLLAVAGLAVDLGGWYARAAAVQKAADAAALAGVVFLPEGLAAAATRAEAVAAQNGFVETAGGPIDVDVEEAGARRLRVTITDSGIDQYFSQLFGTAPVIARSATAEYILPVPMGSPRNFLGTGNDPSDLSDIPEAHHENFWVSVSGYCARREMGDRLTPRTDANGSSFAGCEPGLSASPSGNVRENPEFTPDGYYYGLEFEETASGTYTVEIFDAPHCQGQGSPEDSGTNGLGNGARSGERRYRYSLHAPSLNYRTAPQIGSAIEVGLENCSGGSGSDMHNRWSQFFTVNISASATLPARYYLRIQPLEPTDKTGNDAQEGQNQLSIRVREGAGSFVPCSTDPTVALHSANCDVNVFGVTHLGVYASFVGSAPEFFLASIEPEHSGKVLEVELFDTAEGAERIQVLDPNRNPVDFTWEIACQDGSYTTGVGACTTGENPPRTAGGSTGYGPYDPDAIDNSINVNGDVSAPYRPWGGRNVQPGRYSDRLIRLRIEIPDDYDDLVNSPSGYDGRTWWRIRYTTCSGPDCSVGDRTTWSVSVNGDPVRLVPNT